MKHAHVMQALSSAPWAILPEALETILAIAQRENLDPAAVAAQLGRPLDNTRTVTMRDGVAIVPVRGPLFRYASMFHEISGATSYARLATEFTEALESPEVSAIVLDIDSPGGHVNGLADFAAMVSNARGRKPIKAFVGGTAASAAYWVASAADEIVVAATAMLGSLGTVFELQVSADGKKPLEIVSRQSPKKRTDPQTDEGRAQIQQWADDLADVFIDAVAQNRGVTSEIVLNNYGQGDMMVGQRAVDAGLADRLGTFEGVVASLTGQQTTPTGGFFTATEGQSMADQNNAPATLPVATINTAAELRAAYPAIVAEIVAAETAGHAEAVGAAAAAERERVFAILNCEQAKGREKLAATLAKQGMAAEAAAEILAAAAVEPTAAPAATFGAVMDALGNPAVAADQPAEGEGDAVDQAIALSQRFGII